MADRTYWHVPGARSWHADDHEMRHFMQSMCGRDEPAEAQRADRIPPSAHLCGSCARIIAARTDIEDTGDYGNVAPV